MLRKWVAGLLLSLTLLTGCGPKSGQNSPLGLQSIDVDAGGNLWIGTTVGIFRAQHKAQSLQRSGYKSWV